MWIWQQGHECIGAKFVGDEDEMPLRKRVGAHDGVQPAGLEVQGGAAGIDQRVVKVVRSGGEQDAGGSDRRAAPPASQPREQCLPAVCEEQKEERQRDPSAGR